MSEDGRQDVRRRRVFYIPGYDPFPPRRYRELYRREAARQAAISGYRIALTAAEGQGWRVAGEFGGARVESRFEVLVWSDIVRDSMGRSIAASYGQLLRTAWIYLASGALPRLFRLRKGPVIAALYPVVMLLLQLALAAALGLAAAGLTGRALGAALPPAVAVPVQGVVLTTVLAAVLAWFRARDGRVFAYYLMHDYAFTTAMRGAYPPRLEARLAEFAKRIAEALGSDADEVLVVGHSSGAHLAVSVLAGLIRRGQVRPGGPLLALLTLGQVVPMVSFLPAATRLRADLRLLSESDALSWVDVSAPGDGCSFALCDPVAVSGVAGSGRRWPLVISAAFRQTLLPQTWARLRWRFFRLHFQYLCAFDRPGDYDYFRITAGPLSLARRFAGRAPSRSRIETPLSGHRSLA
ncbi:hypothetical protein [Albidovulum sp.]